MNKYVLFVGALLLSKSVAFADCNQAIFPLESRSYTNYGIKDAPLRKMEAYAVDDVNVALKKAGKKLEFVRTIDTSAVYIEPQDQTYVAFRLAASDGHLYDLFMGFKGSEFGRAYAQWYSRYQNQKGVCVFKILQDDAEWVLTTDTEHSEILHAPVRNMNIPLE